MPNPRKYPKRSEIGDRLRDARNKAGMMLFQVEMETGVHKDYVAQMELYCKFKQLINVAKMCKCYGITLNSLVEGLV